MGKYNHKKIEDNWRDKWFEDNIYKAVDFSDKPKKYILAELPYPSGEFLHVGHMMRYTVPEIYSRYLRMKGFNVLFPMGWDCFGLPGETFAIKIDKTPQEAIKIAVTNFKESLKKMGYAIDWDREISTADPEFYKWTQWMFIRLWKNGLAELQEMPVWWCDELGVLADEEVLPAPDGSGNKVSERGGYPVKRKMFKQWVLKITDYADRLLEDLDKTTYEESVKVGQKNWIGRKEGANVFWEVKDQTLVTFTTRPDTIFGVTFLAIAPEHAALEELLKHATNKEEIKDYIEKTKSLGELERQTKDKTGVQIKGVFAKHPFKEVDREIPVYVADYVLLDFGTGVVQGVPAHDERDFEFAQRYDLEIIETIKNPLGKTPTSLDTVYTGEGEIINSADYNGSKSEEFRKTVTERLEKENKGSFGKTYKIRDQIFSRQRYWGEPIPLIHKEDGQIEAVKEESLPVELPYMENFLPSDDGTSPLARNEEWNKTIDSDGNPATRETDTMPTWAGSNWYYIRYLDPKNNETFCDFEKMKYWLPVDEYFGDAGHTTAHLMYTRFWVKALYDQGLIPIDEPIAYRVSGGMLLGPDGRKMSKSKGNVINPKDVVDNYGADATRTYLAFIGPYDSTYPWNFSGIMACFRLIRNVYEMNSKVADVEATEETLRAINKLIKNTTEMMTEMKLNTAVSQIMIFANHLKTIDQIPLNVWKDFIKVFAPFAPYVTEELWQDINKNEEWNPEKSVHLQEWPTFDEALAKDSELELPVQINGKVKAKIMIEHDMSEDAVKELVMEDPKVADAIKGKEIKKVIYIKDKIINLVI